jgi:hypothetical protein
MAPKCKLYLDLIDTTKNDHVLQYLNQEGTVYEDATILNNSEYGLVSIHI